jgi:hypothetical protein
VPPCDWPVGASAQVSICIVGMTTQNSQLSSRLTSRR